MYQKTSSSADDRTSPLGTSPAGVGYVGLDVVVTA